MKEIIFTQLNPQLGKIKGVLRIIGKNLFFKFNHNQYSQQTIEQLKQKGAEITMGKGWVKVDIFRDRSAVKLGEKEFDLNETSHEEIENILFKFYIEQYKKADFEVETNE